MLLVVEYGVEVSQRTARRCQPRLDVLGLDVDDRAVVTGRGDFEFRPYVGGPGLYLDGKVIATATPANGSPDTPWRLCISPNGIPRYQFLKDEDACLRYMAAWARKWEAEIRKALADVGTGHPYGEVSSPAEPSRHPRGRSRRKSGL